MSTQPKEVPKLRKTKSASEAKELTPNFDWRSLVKDTKSSKQRREMHANMAEKIPKVVHEEEPIRPNDWIKKEFLEKKQEIKDLELNVEVLRRKIDEQKAQIATGDKTNAELTKTNNHLTTQYNNTTKDKYQLELDLKEREEKINQLAKENNEYQMKVTQLEANKKSLENNSELQNKEIKKLKSDLESEEQEKTALCGSLGFKADNLKTEKQNLERLLEQKTVQIADLFRDLSVEEDKSASLHQHIEQLKSANMEVTEELNNSNEQNKDLNKKLNDKVRDYLIIENDYEKLTIEKEQVINLNKQILNKNENLQKQIESQKAEIDELCEKFESFHGEVATIELAKETLACEKNELLNQLEDLEQEYENLSINHDNVNTENDGHKLKIEQLTKKLIEQDEIIGVNESKLNELEEKISQANEEISKLEVARMDELDCSSKTIEELQSKNTKLTHDFNNMKLKVNHQEQVINKLKTENDSIATSSINEIEALQNENETLGVQISKLKQSLEQVKSEWGVSMEKCDKLKQKENQQLNEITLLKTKISKLLTESEMSEGKINELRNNLDDANIKCEENNLKMESYQVKINLLEETVAQLEKKTQLCEEKVNVLENTKSELNESMNTLKITHQQAIEEIIKEKDQILMETQKCLDNAKNELDERKKQHHADMDDIMKNFGDLENELSFCQDELNTKGEELTQLKSELNQVKSDSKMRETVLAKELGSLNEQNETILQNEVNRYKAECDERLREYREKSTNDITNIHNEFQEKIEYLKQQYDNTKAWEVEKIQTMHDGKLSELNKEKEELIHRIKYIEDSLKTHIESNEEKEREIDRKSKLIEKLTTRIETQQKMIDYVMKTLGEERQRKSDFQIIDMLTDIKEKVNVKPSVTKQVVVQPNFLYNHENQRSRLSTHSSLYTDDPASEVGFPLSPSPVSSPRLHFDRESIFPQTTSTPSKLVIPLPYLQTDDAKLNQSLPESDMHDLGYDSPGLGNSYQSMYFEDQIKSITKTFQDIESINSNRENKTDMEIWKQKIHFRLKALENQMNQLEHENSIVNQSNSVISSGWLALQRSKSDAITYRPSNDQIRALIETVNKKYQTLSGCNIAV